MHILDILTVCLRKKFLIICIPLVCAALAFAVSSAVPKIYYTEIRLKIDDPLSMTKLTGMADLGKNFSQFFGSTGQNESEELFLELLGGRDNLVSAINEFSLDTLYKTKILEGTIKSFKKDLNIDILSSSNIIICGFRGKNLNLAVEIVRFMVNNANNRFLSLQKERLAMTTEFLTERQKQLMDSLELTCKELITFYRENNVIDIENQIELTLLTLARYEEQINSNRASEMISKNAAGLNTPMGQELRVRNQILQGEFQKIRGNYKEDYKPSKQSVLINTDWGLDKMLFEQIAKNKITLIKDILSTMSKELAISEAQLSKNIPAIQLIQDAFYPDWKVAPKKSIWMMASFCSSFLLTVSYILLAAFVRGELEGSSDVNRQKLIKLLKAAWK